MPLWLHWILLTLASAQVRAEDRCTALLVGAKASTTGAPMTTHTNDCASCDFRIGKVPAMKYPSGAMRDVVIAKFDYPRYVGDQRGQVFEPRNLDPKLYNWSTSHVIGQIPEAQETFAYIDGSYGILNEHQVALGESTCPARFYSKPQAFGGDALMDVSELSRIALQRCTTARCAVQTMGDLGVKYGYYGAEWEGDDVFDEAGEAITVTDASEAWMFHILPDDTGKSAIWVAQRVPDDHICAIANQFVIHQIDLTNAEYFMGSDNIYEVAKRNGIWRSEEQDGPFDFTRVYSKPRAEGQQHYSTRRVWRIFTLSDPSLNLSPFTDVYSSDYPFSIKPSRKLSPQDIMGFHRDHYEGTPFDMTNGPAAGPYGNPDRYDPSTNEDVTKADLSMGSFERAISIFRTSYSYVTVLNPRDANMAYMWYGPYSAHATLYTPVYAQVLETPPPFSTGSLFAFDQSISFWANAIVGNWVSHFYKFAHPVVAQAQQQQERAFLSEQPQVLEQARQVLATQGTDAMRQYLTQQSQQFTTKGVTVFARLFEYLVTVFHDGYQMTGLDTSALRPIRLFYPKWWLQQVGFFGSKNRPTSVQSLRQGGHGQVAASLLAEWPTLLVAVVIALGIGFYAGRVSKRGHQYTRI